MYLRRPLAQRGSPRRRLSRWGGPSCPKSSRTQLSTNTTTAAAAAFIPNWASNNDFDHYVRSECTDTLFSTDASRRASRAESATSSPSLRSTTAPLNSSPPPRTRNYLNCGPEVAALPSTHTILNNVNSAIWLQVLTCLQERGALTTRDCAGAIRYLPAFTYRPLLPWLWTPALTSTSSVDSATGNFTNGDGTLLKLEGNEGAGAGFNTFTCANAAADEAEAGTEVYNNMPLVTPEAARRVSLSPTIAGKAVASIPSRVACAVTDFGTAAPHLWVTMAETLTSALPASTSLRADRLKLWHDVLFTLRSHATWNGTTVELREVAHPQLLAVFRAFYADMQFHDLDVKGENDDGTPAVETKSNQLYSGSTVTAVQTITLMPPILLRKFRTLYRQHRHSAMLFAELYSFCVTHEEQSVRCWETTGKTATTATSSSKATNANESRVVHLRTTALLMDVDLAVYFASLPGRRYSGLATPAEQWTATLHHFNFLIPRLHFLQRCLQAQQERQQEASPSFSISTDLWDPWRRVAAVLMNVCVWVENDNEEATRCCAALRCVVDALQKLQTPHVEDTYNNGRTRTFNSGSFSDGCRVHTALGAPNTKDIATFIMTLVTAAGDSMRTKAAQLHYGPTDGLFGISLLSVAVSAVLPAASALEAASKAMEGMQPQQEEAKTELLQQLRVFTHAAKTTPMLIWSALRRTPHVASAARYGLVTVGYRLFRDCVVPQASQSSTVTTAQRLYGMLCEWAGEVGRPLGLQGWQVSTLWQLRWIQQQEGVSGEGGKQKGRLSKMKALLQTLAPARRHNSFHSNPNNSNKTSSGGKAPAKEWVCGCGFVNAFGDEDSLANSTADTSSAASVSCVACVLRDLVPHSWECPTCHTASASGVLVPYCLHCGEAHPSIAGRRQHTHLMKPEGEEKREEKAAAQGVVYICAACLAISSKAPASLRSALQPASTVATNVLVHYHNCKSNVIRREGVASHQECCSICGSEEGGYYTAAFTWMCGCGTTNSAMQDYCTPCSNAALRPALTCPQCHHRTSIDGSSTAERCSHCHYPHPRRVAAVQERRLVRCPACQGLAPANAHQCPHCSSSALSAVAALLPTVADQPWLCLHCGTKHSVRDVKTGELQAPPLSALSGLTFVVAASSHIHNSEKGKVNCVENKGNIIICDEDRCNHCGTPRVPATAWEPAQLWNCSCCGTLYNTTAACRQCAALAPGVAAADVSVWKCEICHAEHPSWQTHCTTAGCGGSIPLFQQYNNNNRDDSNSSGGSREDCVARYCYSPWECALCGQVTLSSHLRCCTSCGAATPTAVFDTACTSATCAKAMDAVVNANYEELSSNGSSACDVSSLATHASFTSVAGVQQSSLPPRKNENPSSRLAEVEAFLLRAAETGAPLHAMTLGSGLVCLPSTGLIRPSVDGVTNDTGAKADGIGPAGQTADTVFSMCNSSEAWEDAYNATVLSF